MISLNSFGLIILSSAILLSYAYCLDLFQALQVYFREQPYNFSTMEFNLMYFFTYLPILLFNIPIGMIIDRSSVVVSLFVLLFMSLISQLVCTLMVQTQITGYIVIMYLMRSFFGVAGQGLFTVQGLIVTRCCKDNYDIVLSIALSLPFIFDALNSVVTTNAYSSTKIMAVPWYIGVFCCILSLLAGCLLYKYYLIEKQRKQERLIVQSDQNQKSIIEKQKQQENQECNIRQLRSFPFAFWILIVTSFFTQSCLAGFLDNLNDLFVKRFNISYTDAGAILIIPNSALTIFSIIFGILMSKKPSIKRSMYVLSTLMYLIGHISLYLLPQTQNPTALYYVVASFFCLTVSFGFSMYYSVIIVAIPYVVQEKTVGTAFGVLGSVIGLSQCMTPWINIAIIDSNDDLKVSYKSLNFAYIIISFVAFILAVYIKLGPFQKIDSKLEEKVLETESIEDDSLISIL